MQYIVNKVCVICLCCKECFLNIKIFAFLTIRLLNSFSFSYSYQGQTIKYICYESLAIFVEGVVSSHIWWLMLSVGTAWFESNICHLTTSVPSQDQAGDMKHDSISSPGISDQEKEMASNAFEAFKVNNYNLSRRLYPWLFPAVIVDDITWCFFRLEAMTSPWNILTAFRSLTKRTTRLQWIKRSMSFIKVGRQQPAPWSRR